MRRKMEYKKPPEPFAQAVLRLVRVTGLEPTAS